jgi:hypothetical protein
MTLLDLWAINLSVALIIGLVFGAIGKTENGVAVFFVVLSALAVGSYFEPWNTEKDCLPRSEYTVIKNEYKVKYIYEDHLVSSSDVYIYNNAEDTTKVKFCRVDEINAYGHLIEVNYKITEENETK